MEEPEFRGLLVEALSALNDWHTLNRDYLMRTLNALKRDTALHETTAKELRAMYQEQSAAMAEIKQDLARLANAVEELAKR